ncbi:MAG: trypsin-like serine protease [Myxococcales bacterium]|nr:trypsin-like serine protease [Myxococcales bacterium]
MRSSSSALVPTALALALAAPLVAACVETPAVDDRALPVIGGSRTADGAFPGVGALLYDFGGGQIGAGCTGTLIAPDVVLTAAHCLDPQLTGVPKPAAFTLAHDTLSGTPTQHPVDHTLRHPQFDINAAIGGGLAQFFDIGLVFLGAPVTDVAPIKMPTPDEATALAVDTDLTIVGYGQIADTNPVVGVMYDATTAIRELAAAEMRVSRGGADPQNCHGDSGGPALTTIGGGERVVGVVSRSYQSNQCDNGGIDTRVDAYLDWIHANVPAGIPCGSGLAEACPVEDDAGGCCSTGGPAPSSIALGGLAAALALRRRRR